MKSVQIQSFSGPYFPVFGLNKRKYGPEKTLYLDTFHTVKYTPPNFILLLLRYSEFLFLLVLLGTIGA